MRIKICGITRKQDAQLAANLGADALGFIFYPKSPRFIEPERAAEIAKDLPKHIARVVVCVSPTADEINAFRQVFKFDVLQVHGELKPELESFKNEFDIVPALSVGEKIDLKKLKYAATFSGIVLLDTAKKGMHGGTGEVFDWHNALAAKKHTRIVLAGGLSPVNIIEAVEFVQPYAVDVNSGVESAPGIKKHEKITTVFEKLKEYRSDWQPEKKRPYPLA